MSTLVGNTVTILYTPATAVAYTVRLVSDAHIVEGSIVVPSVRRYYTENSGDFIITLAPGDYEFVFAGQATFRVNVPADDNEYPFNSRIISDVTQPGPPPSTWPAAATATNLGAVRTKETAGVPVVYLAEQIDKLFEDQDSEIQEVEAAATAAEAAAAAAQVQALEAQSNVAAAMEAAEAAVAAADSFPIASFLGTITTLGTDPGAAAPNSGKWWQIGVSGGLSHVNAGGHVVGVGDRLLSNGTAWLHYVTPPTYLPDGVVTADKLGLAAVLKPKLSADLQAVIPDSEENPTYLWAVVDAARFQLVGIRTTDGKMEVTLAPDKAQTLEDLTAGGARHQSDDYDVLWAIRDSAGFALLKILKSSGEVIGRFTMPEVVNARGSRTSLTERIDASLTPYGMPKRAIWGEEYLPETRQRLRKRVSGDSAQLVIAAIGDSWTHNYARYTGPLTSALQSTYGVGGAGWCGFSWPSGLPLLSNGSVDPTRLAFTVTGTWTPQYAAAATPDIGTISSSVVGDKVTVSGPASASGARLVWVGATSASIRYRWDGGSWTTVAVSTSGTNSTLLSGMPSTAWTLEIEVVAGAPLLSGLDVQSTANGITFHKLGSTGSTAAAWTAVDATNWQAGFTLLAPQLVIVMFGTNDQGAYDESVFSGHIQTLITRIRAARPVADILLVAPCENLAGRARSMTLYSEKLRILASVNSCAFLDLQPFFGTLPPNYGSGSERPWFNSDTFHPDPATGGRAIVDAIARILTH